MTIQKSDPTTRRAPGSSEHTKADLDRLVDLAEQGASRWRQMSVDARSQVMSAAAEELQRKRDPYAALITTEMGKPIGEAESEIGKCIWACKYYAEQAAERLAQQPGVIDETRSYLRFEPLGPILAILSWDSPFWQFFRFAAPALMAGNVALLKHAPNVPQCTMALEQVFDRAGFPEGVLATLRVGDTQVANLIGNPAVKAVTLTGSEAAGRAVAAEAGKHLKKCILELGGSDPFLVFADADLHLAAEQAARAGTINSGQSDIAAKRFIVEASVADDFTAALVAEMMQLKVGDPMDRDTDIGPLAHEDLRDELHGQVARSVDAGAELRCGGELPAGKGAYYPPTVLANVKPGMPVFDEETTGPVLAVIPVRDVDHAVEVANQSRSWKAASIWTSGTRTLEPWVGDLQCDCVFVNEIVKSDLGWRFGGLEHATLGQELSGFGIRDFTRPKSVWNNAFDMVEEASKESFPASDPPSWTPVTSS